MILLYIIIPVIYCEWLWKRVLNGKKTFEQVQQLLIIIACFIGLFIYYDRNSPYVIGEIAYVLTLLLYRLVIFPYRKEKNGNQQKTIR